MKAMKSLTKKAQTMALLLGVTGAVLTSVPLQAEAGQRTLLASNGLRVQACRAGTRVVKFSGFYAAPARNGFLAGNVHLSSRSFGSISLTQGRWVGNGAGGHVSLNPRHVTVRGNYVRPVRVGYTKGFPAGKRPIYIDFHRIIHSFSVSGLPRC
ncbi:MAG: hypothetical protein Q4D91_14290 [Lautropia sp.]|nr:hypothetical protein [Lautropia sp.]